MSFTLPRTARKYMERYNCERWATLDDLIAQADKAERLQEAVDCALQVLDNVSEIGGIDLQIAKIKQLIKETTNDK